MEPQVNVDSVIQYALGKVDEGLKARVLGVYDLQAYVEILRTIKGLQAQKSNRNEDIGSLVTNKM